MLFYLWFFLLFKNFQEWSKEKNSEGNKDQIIIGSLLLPDNYADNFDLFKLHGYCLKIMLLKAKKYTPCRLPSTKCGFLKSQPSPDIYILRSTESTQNKNKHIKAIKYNGLQNVFDTYKVSYLALRFSGGCVASHYKVTKRNQRLVYKTLWNFTLTLCYKLQENLPL